LYGGAFAKPSRRGKRGRLCVGCGCALIVAYFFMPQAFANYYALATWVFILGFACAGPMPNLREL